MLAWFDAIIQSHPKEVAAAISTASVAFGQLIRELWARWRKYKQEELNAEASGGDMLAIQNQLQRIVNETAALRAFIVVVTNGGGALREAKSNLFITIVSEATLRAVEPIKNHWSRREVTDSYRASVLSHLIEKDEKSIILDLSEVNPGQLRDQWQVSDVLSASIETLWRAEDDRKLVYLAVHHAAPASMVMPNEDDDEDPDSEDSAVRSSRAAFTRWVISSAANTLKTRVKGIP
jgi:hypothetical protein